MASYIVEQPVPLPLPEPQIHLTLSPSEARAALDVLLDEGLYKARSENPPIYKVIAALRDARETLESA